MLVLGQVLRVPSQIDALDQHAHDRLMIGGPAASETR
jgi:hypothetical protein